MQLKQKLHIRTRQVFASVLAALLIFNFSFPSAVAAEVATPAASTSSSAPSVDTPAPVLTPPSPAPTPSPSESTPAPTPTPTPSPSPAPATASLDTLLATPATLAAPSSPTLTQAPSTNVTAEAAPSVTTAPVTPAPDQTISLQTNVNSNATSGNAAVLNNDHAGNATSGKASADATIVNVVGSGTGFGTTTTFVKNIYNTPGSNEIQGSVTIDPTTLLATEGATTNPVWYNPTQSSVSLTDIENNVVLNATSGTADVTGNDHAGDATTGDASALANIVNIVSSSIGAQHTFLGVVNIFGNLKGDILVPASLVDSLFGSNSPAATTASATPSTTNDINITNNVALTAASGAANVSDNDHAGNATTGNATTNLTVYNLTGQEIIAKNSLLVFVNVLGKWVGMIINAPAGSTAAALTGGSSTTANTGEQLADGTYDSTVNIRNNVTANATSGNANVTDNDHAGNATTGNAAAGANILNLVHSSFSLNDWFGVLFINVIGSWLGNFGIAPADPTAPAPGGSDTSGGVQAVRVFRFTGTTTFKHATPAKKLSGSRVAEPALATVAATQPTDGHVLGDSDGGNLQALPRSSGGRDFTSAIVMLVGLLLLVLLSALIVRRRRLSHSSL